jgi:flagellar protein FlgJ
MQGSLQPILPLQTQNLNGMDTDLAFSTGAMSKALSVGTDIAAKAAGKVGSGGIASLDAGQAMSLGGTKAHSQAEMQKVAKQFEAIFLRMLMQQMRSSVEKGSIVGNSRTMEMFQSMQDDNYADRLSEQGIGLGDMVYRQLMTASLRNNQKTGNASI